MEPAAAHRLTSGCNMEEGRGGGGALEMTGRTVGQWRQGVGERDAAAGGWGRARLARRDCGMRGPGRTTGGGLWGGRRGFHSD